MTLSAFYRMQAKPLTFLFLWFGVAVMYFAWVNIRPGIYLMLGLLAGVLLRDFGIARLQKKLWPVQYKLLDWQKVQRMADGEQLDR